MDISNVAMPNFKELWSTDNLEWVEYACCRDQLREIAIMWSKSQVKIKLHFGNCKRD